MINLKIMFKNYRMKSSTFDNNEKQQLQFKFDIMLDYFEKQMNDSFHSILSK